MPRPPLPPYPERYLQAWRFDDPAWLITGGWGTLAALNLQQRESWSGYALDLSRPGPALFALPAKALDGQPNLTLESGTVRFYFAPDWSSAGLGGGPGGETRLLEFGAWSEGGQQSLAWLAVDGMGTMMRLAVQGAGEPVEILRAPVQWAAGQWHQVALVWSGKETVVLYLDGQAVAVGAGLDLNVLNQLNGMAGFCLGSDVEGNRLAQGQFEELYTFSRACPAEEVAWNYEVQAKRTTLGPITEEEEQARFEAVAKAISLLQSQGGGVPQATMSGGCGPGLCLEMVDSPTEVTLLVRNAIGGKEYFLLSMEDFDCLCWIHEQTFTVPVSETEATLVVQKNGRKQLLLMVMESEVAVVEESFEGLNMLQTQVYVADNMGAIGLNHFVELLNGRIAVFQRATGQLLQEMESKAFFKVPGTALPVGNTYDPKIYYDHFQNRWVATVTDTGSDHVLLAVSNSDDGNPTDLDGNWTKHDVPLTMPLAPLMDFPTLGLDANGIYISVARIGEGAHDVVAIKKPNIYQGSLVATVLPKVQQSELDADTIQPVFNFDNPPSGGFAWFLAKGRPGGGVGGKISYRRLQWNGTTAEWAGDWGQLAGSSYTSYFDLDESTVSAPQPIVSHRIHLGSGLSGGVGSRLSASVIRNNTVWTCHSCSLSRKSVKMAARFLSVGCGVAGNVLRQRENALRVRGG
jgi:hypothetical protein